MRFESSLYYFNRGKEGAERYFWKNKWFFTGAWGEKTCIEAQMTSER